MKKFLTLVFGLMIATVAVWAIPRDVKKDLPGIEKSIKMKIEVVKANTVALVAINDQGESPGQFAEKIYSINFIDQVAEEIIAQPIDYSYSWRPQNYSDSNKNLAKIKLFQHKISRQLLLRC